MIAETGRFRVRRGSARKSLGVLALLVLAGGLVYGGATGFCFRSNDTTEPQPDTGEPSLGGIALFSTWPKNTKPDAVIILSGQTFGFLQPCGCSRPQMGGLERRANFMDSLRKKGWQVAGVDLGDVFPDHHPIGPSGIITPPGQALIKYRTMMNSLREMGYVAVGVGKTEFAAGLHKVTAEYALQKEQTPYLLAGNVKGYAAPPGATRPLIGTAEIADFGGIAVGIVGMVSPALAAEAVKLDPVLDFEKNVDWLKKSSKDLAESPQKPAVNVLLYQGSAEFAKKIAKDFPAFSVILCQAEDSEPPQFPEYVDRANGGRTMIVQVGHKGRYVGAVGIYKTAKGIELKYQLVPLGEEYLTPNDPAAEKANKILSLFEDYAERVKKENSLGKITPVAHPAQIQQPKLNLSYVGSEKCAACHGGEQKKWADSKHGHALEALEKIAKRPGLRNLDAECVVCHTIGFGFKTGYENEVKTPNLKHVGCESCHGPGSGHVSAERNAALLKLQSPWKQAPTDKLPDLATMEKIAKLTPIERNQVKLTEPENVVVNAVSTMCMKCHDVENDPHFDLFKYWPKISHSGLGAK